MNKEIKFHKQTTAKPFRNEIILAYLATTLNLSTTIFILTSYLLDNCICCPALTHIFVRNEVGKPLLTALYAILYSFVSDAGKVFTIDLNDRKANESVEKTLS